MKEFSEIQIINGCKVQDQYFQKVLVLRYSSLLMTVCCRYTDTYPAAQDVLQESFLKILKGLPNLNHEGSFEAWMKKIVINTALNSKCNKRFRFEYSGIDHLKEQQVLPEALSNLNAAELVKMISTLPDGYRVIFNLAAIEGYTHVEISKMLNIAPSTSRSQLARARKILQEKLVRLEKKIA